LVKQTTALDMALTAGIGALLGQSSGEALMSSNKAVENQGIGHFAGEC
jgi:hypothetical protein